MIDAHILNGDIVILEDRKDVAQRGRRRGLDRWRDNFEAVCHRCRWPAVLKAGESAVFQY